MTTFTLANYADYVDNTNTYYGDHGNHTWYALKGEDTLRLGNGRDVAYGYWGADYIYGGGGNDKLYGDTGHDTLIGDDGFDELYGGDGNDRLRDAYNGADNIFGGLGNDEIRTDGGKVNAGAGNDTVQALANATTTNILVGTGSDEVDLHFSTVYSSPHRVDLRQFTASDKLTLHAYTDYDHTWYDPGQVLDILDRNNDGWLGAKDVESYDNGDGFGVHVGASSLTLEIAENDVVLYGMTKASFDFLS